MKRLVFLAAALAAFVFAASASADVQRYQIQYATLTADVLGGAYVHVYDIAISPCDNSFTGSGGIESLGLDETVSGTLSDSNTTIDFQAEYLTYNPGYAWSYEGPLSGGTAQGPNGQTFPVTFALDLGETSTFKTHGDYVSTMGGGEDAAHSCIGKPIK